MDCSDPACEADFACVPSSVPSGWTGYFALYDGPPAGDPGCLPAFPTSTYLGNSQINAPPASCSTCTCGSPSGQKCEVNGTVDVADATCGTTNVCEGAVTPPTGWTGTCFGINGLGAGVVSCGPQTDMTCKSGNQPCNVSELLGPVIVTGGTCAPSTQTPVSPTVSWDNAGEACGDAQPTGKGCATGLCLPKPKAPFQSGMCIMHTGDTGTCPAGVFTQKHVFYDPSATQDTRTCSPCACGSASGATCSATVNVYSSTNCTGLIATLNATTTAGDCKNLSSNPAVAGFSATFTTPSGGNCAATGGQPTGMAVPQSPTTFCCIP